MDITQLRAFACISESLSYSEAADKLCLTQPAITKRIQNLEAQLGVQLFHRVGRKIQLTTAGEQLLPQAQKVIADVDRMVAYFKNLSGEVSGDLRLGTSHYLGADRIKNVLANFCDRYPKVQLDLHFSGSEQAYQDTAAGKLDASLVTLPEYALPHVATITIWKDPLVFVISKKCLKRKKFSFACLEQTPAIPVDVIFSTEVIDKKFAPLNLHIGKNKTSYYFESVRTMVTLGLGWSVLPQHMVTDDMCVFEVPGIKLVRKLGLAYSTQYSLTNATKALIDEFSSQQEMVC